MQNSHITLTCAALVNHNSLRKDEHGVEANGVTCTKGPHKSQLKQEIFVFQHLLQLRSSTFLQQKVSFC